MLTDLNFSIKLPLKIILGENKNTTKIVYQKTEELSTRYQVAELQNSIRKMDEGIEAIIKQVIAK